MNKILSKTIKLTNLVVFVAIALSLNTGCEQPVDDNGDSGGSGSFSVYSLDSDMNEPAWIDNNTLIATTGFDNRIITFNTAGTIANQYTVSTANGTVDRLNLISVSPDSSTASFHIEYESGTRDIATIDLDTQNVTVVSDSTGPYHGTSYDGNAAVYFFSYQEDESQHTMKLMRTPIANGTDTVVFSETAAAVDSSATEAVYYWPRAHATGNRILLMTDLNDGGDGEISYEMVNDSGSVLKELSSFARFDQAAAGDWLSSTEILAAGRTDDNWNVYRIDVDAETVTPVLTDVPDELLSISGINLSPDGSRAAAHVRWRDPATNAEDNRLMVVTL